MPLDAHKTDCHIKQESKVVSFGKIRFSGNIPFSFSVADFFGVGEGRGRGLGASEKNCGNKRDFVTRFQPPKLGIN